MQQQALEPVAAVVHRAKPGIIVLDKFVLFPQLATEREITIWPSAKQRNVFDRIEQLDPIHRVFQIAIILVVPQNSVFYLGFIVVQVSSANSLKYGMRTDAYLTGLT